jgi:6-phosphofructokinase 1
LGEISGNLVVAQSGGPTAVINASLVGVIQEALKHSEIFDIYGSLHGIEGILYENLIDLKKEDPKIVEKIKRTPSSALGSCRQKLTPENYKRIIDVFKAHNIRYFFYIGGNDSMDTAHTVGKMTQDLGYELTAIGIPKTIDNDLDYTDHCPGYGSVARWIATAVRDAGFDTEAIGVVDKVKVIEIMGRNAGWITAASALGKEKETDAPHLIYLPERAVNVDKLLSDVERWYKKLGYVVIAICEGAKGEDGKPLKASAKSIDLDSFGHLQMGGAAEFLCNVISEKLKLKARFDKPGTIQRVSMALVSEVDLSEAYMVGQKAVEYAVNGIKDKMVSLVREGNGEGYVCKTGLVDLEKVANSEKLIPDEFINEEGNGVTEKFYEYALPLIGGALLDYARFKVCPVQKKL